MISGSEIMQFTGSINNFMNSRIAEFNNFPCFNINQMIMLSALVCSFKLSNVFTELMFDNKIAVKKKFNCII